ncbi:MAG: glycosyltransferase family 39 protein [Acidobacteriota bacterium]
MPVKFNRGARSLKFNFWPQKLNFNGLALPLAVITGAALRLYQIELQIIADDEWHALHAVLTRGYLSIASHFGGADYSIPMALLYELGFDLYGLSEMIMRAPVLLFGLVSLLVFPLMVRQQVGRSAANALAWLLAVSPMHIYYSRYARPYAIMLFFVFVGALAFYRWWAGGDRKWRFVYLACALLAPYFHLSAIFISVAPLLFALIETGWLKRHSSRDLKEVLQLGLMLGAGLGLLLGIPLIFDFRSIAGKAAENIISPQAFIPAAHLLGGSRELWLIFLLGTGTLAGGVLLAKQQSRFFLYLAVLVGVHFAALVLSGPALIFFPIVFARYLLPALPFLMLLLAGTLGHGEHWLRERIGLYPQGLITMVLAVCLLFFGPLAQTYYSPNNWTNHALFQYYYDFSNKDYSYSHILKPDKVSEFYHELGRFPRNSLTLVEAPWYFEWHNIHYPYLQHVHGQRMMIGFVEDPSRWSRPGELPVHIEGMNFRNFVHVADTARLAQSGARFVIFHKNLKDEIPNDAPRPALDVSPWISHYRKLYGEPLFEDSDIVVFDISGSLN